MCFSLTSSFYLKVKEISFLEAKWDICVVLNVNHYQTGMIINYISNLITTVLNTSEKTKCFVTIYIIKKYKIHVAVLEICNFQIFKKHIRRDHKVSSN